ncbi:hypothetical protein HDE_13306 [Halotydeus destructor]|nr:hypothetical protein HDE_13306 [Halotydeus destructor]
MSLSILQFICLLCLGLIDPCGNVLILYIWGKGGQDYLLTIHFTFGLGGLVAPLVTSPFLYTGEGSSLELDGNATSIVADLCVKEALRIHIPYAIMGAFSVLTSCLFLYLFCCHRHTTEHESRLVNVDKDMADGVKQEMIRHKRIVVVVAAIFLLTLMCFSLGMSSFVSSFAVLSDLHLGKQDGAYLLSLFYFTYTFYLLFSIPLVNKIGINRNIIMELGLIVLANIFLVPFGNSVEWCLWVGVALMGLGISTMYASLFVLLEGYFPVTGGIASFLTVVAFLGGWMYPVVMGYAIGNDPQFFLNVILMFTVACILLFAILSYLLWKWFPVKHDVQKQTTIDSCES